MMHLALLCFALALLAGSPCEALISSPLRRFSSSALATTRISFQDGKKIVTCTMPLGKGYEDLEVQFRPLFANSEFIVVSYAVPFGLNVEKPPKNFPAPMVTKDGPGGEMVGDVLRATTCFSQGFQAAGAASDIAAFAGNIKWRRSVFDATGAQWEQTVQALVSNTAERTDSVTLVFEREVEGPEPPASDV